MNVHVFDTHVTDTNGNYYHFDVIVDDANTKDVDRYVKNYLNSLNVTEKTIEKSTCGFCHSEPATEQMIKDIQTKGHYILPMQGCPR
ncbi:DUF2024 family protein [Alteromonadaceae bacterium M269]|nr:DUF2024 family protein [Alteromonadaceae bacterium M269]